MTLEAQAREVVSKPIPWGSGSTLVRLHKALIGGHKDDWYCTTCSAKLRKMYEELKEKYYLKIMAKTGKYSFKDPNASVRSFGSGEVITASNLTDEKAEELIKTNEAYKQLFEVAGEEPKKKGADKENN